MLVISLSLSIRSVSSGIKPGIVTLRCWIGALLETWRHLQLERKTHVQASTGIFATPYVQRDEIQQFGFQVVYLPLKNDVRS